MVFGLTRLKIELKKFPCQLQRSIHSSIKWIKFYLHKSFFLTLLLIRLLQVGQQYISVFDVVAD